MGPILGTHVPGFQHSLCIGHVCSYVPVTGLCILRSLFGFGPTYMAKKEATWHAFGGRNKIIGPVQSHPDGQTHTRLPG